MFRFAGERLGGPLAGGLATQRGGGVDELVRGHAVGHDSHPASGACADARCPTARRGGPKV